MEYIYFVSYNCKNKYGNLQIIIPHKITRMIHIIEIEEFISNKYCNKKTCIVNNYKLLKRIKK